MARFIVSVILGQQIQFSIQATFDPANRGRNENVSLTPEL